MEGVVELDGSARRFAMAQNEQLLELARTVANTTLRKVLEVPDWESGEEYSHSLHRLEAVGRADVEGELDTPEAQAELGSLREDYESSVIEMMHTDKEFRRKLENNRERQQIIHNGHVLGFDGRTTMQAICKAGARSAARKAQLDERMVPVAERTAADVRNAIAVDALPVGHMRIGISNYLKEAMERYGTKFYDDMGNREHLGFYQWYYRLDEHTMVAGSYSVDDCDIDTMCKVWNSFADTYGGGHIPEGLATPTWLDCAIEIASKTLDEARGNVTNIRDTFYKERGVTEKRYSVDDFMALNKEAVDHMFNGLYRSLARAYYLRKKNRTLHTLVDGLLQSPQGLHQRVRTQLLDIYNSENLDAKGARLLEQLIRYATTEKLRQGLKFIGTQAAPKVTVIAVTPGMTTSQYMEQLARSSAENILDGARAGRTYGGCTPSINLSEHPDADSSVDPTLNPQEAYGGLGDKKEKWHWKKGLCQIGNCPTRPHTTMVGPCSVCWNCQKKFDKGMELADIIKVYEKRASLRAVRALGERLLQPTSFAVLRAAEQHQRDTEDTEEKTRET